MENKKQNGASPLSIHIFTSTDNNMSMASRKKGFSHSSSLCIASLSLPRSLSVAEQQAVTTTLPILARQKRRMHLHLQKKDDAENMYHGHTCDRMDFMISTYYTARHSSPFNRSWNHGEEPSLFLWHHPRYPFPPFLFKR
mmetsp:Transcript_3255/g.7210  ORF Transcript_3255/g.7210 Transcript_3255/m.7210 type:complete len:140 (-) Transcript_3255:945-1364(-)